ncbi:hypothetical protein HY442_00860 [Candidatus Parcubacteria bacterium]|nr:hypothetical protein [Candidatus Parcubacteria bacterium]MBI4099060.1 hypothetical protein [Candidatus Parcubacteria bacterium]MBI4385576.1 hypothetical protein [Candidatus Parcubacteria bacterium]
MDLKVELDGEIERLRSWLKESAAQYPTAAGRWEAVQQSLRGAEWTIRLLFVRAGDALSCEKFRVLQAKYLGKLAEVEKEAWRVNAYPLFRYVLEGQVGLAKEVAAVAREHGQSVPEWFAPAFSLAIATFVRRAEQAGLFDCAEGTAVRTDYAERIAAALNASPQQHAA